MDTKSETIGENQNYVWNENISNEDLINKYKKYLDCLKYGIKENEDNGVIDTNDSPHLCEYVNEIIPNDSYCLKEIIFDDINADILLKSFATLFLWLHIDAGPYVKFIIYYKNGDWFKYNTNNPYPINHQMSTIMTENELQKLIKSKLYNLQKKITINMLLEDVINYEDDLILLGIKQYHLQYFNQHLHTDSEFYRKLLVLIKYLFELEDKQFAT